MRAWWGFGFGVVMIAAAYAADVLVGDALDESRRTFSASSVQGLETMARVGVVVAVLGMAWLVLRGPRERLVGLAMVVVGCYVGLVPELSIAFLVNTSIPLPPLATEILGHATDFTTWAATAVAVLGVVELLAPTHAPSRAGVVPAIGATA